MEEGKIYRHLDEVLGHALPIPISSEDRLVIFSDLHMGDGSSVDDFGPNSGLFRTALEQYYFARDFQLILNGDVEELQRFPLPKILKTWEPVYSIFREFSSRGGFFKTVGNHDLGLTSGEITEYPFPIYEALKLNYNEHTLLVFHGHQASKRFRKNNEWVGFTLRYLATPLRIKNYSVAHNSRKQYRIEKRAYRFSKYKKIASIIGHTHRPLFESLSKAQRLRHKIEQLCRESAENGGTSDRIVRSISNYRKELEEIVKNEDFQNYGSPLYQDVFSVPSLFNSGCVIGKRGITCLEIEKGRIRLVHWFDQNISKKYLLNTGYGPEKFDQTDYYRMVLNEEDLDYIFARIDHLS